jgi:hypothetical protein
VQTALVATAKRLDQLRAGSEPTVQAFSRIGLSLQSFAGKDTAQSLTLIAQKLAAVPDSAEKTALSQELLNKTSADLIPTLNDLGNKGLQFFIDKATETGNLIDGPFVQAAAAAADALTDLQLHATGVANSFAAGFAPALTGVIEDVTKAFGSDGEASDSIKNFGVFLGVVIRTVLAVFTTAAQGIGAVAAIATTTISGLFTALGDIATAKPAAALAALKGIVSQGATIIQSFSDDIDKKLADISTPPAPKVAPPKPTGTIAPPVDPGIKLIADARLAALQKMYANELDVEKANLAAKADAEKDSYDEGLVSYTQYFDARRALLIASVAEELATLKAQKATLSAAIVTPAAGATLTPTQQAGNIKIQSDIATVNSQIRVKQIQSAQQLAELDNQELQTQLSIGKAREGTLNTLDDLEENRHAIFERNLAQEVQDLKKLAGQAGTSQDEIDAEVAKLTQGRTANFNLDEATRQGSDAMTEFARQQAAINSQVQTGILDEVSGQTQIAELQKEQLPLLQKQADALTAAAAATGSPEQIAKAKAFADSVTAIGNSYKGTTDEALQFEVGGLNAFDKGIVSLADSISTITSVGDAFRTLAITIAKALADIAAQILAKQATLALARALGLGTSGIASTGGAAVGESTDSILGDIAGGFAAGGFRGGLVKGYAAGDVVAGKAINVQGPDKIPAMLEHNEFVVRRNAATQPGAVSFLRAFNAGHLSMASLRRLGVQRFAAGGFVGPSGAVVTAPAIGNSQPPGVRILNVMHPDFVSEGLATPNSERAVINIISRNANAISRVLRR